MDIFKDGVRFPDGYRFCGGENHSDVIERVTKELKKIASEYPNANVLVVCHGSAIKHIVNVLCPGFVDEKPNTAALVPNCSVTRMDCDTELKLIKIKASINSETLIQIAFAEKIRIQKFPRIAPIINVKIIK